MKTYNYDENELAGCEIDIEYSDDEQILVTADYLALVLISSALLMFFSYYDLDLWYLEEIVKAIFFVVTGCLYSSVYSAVYKHIKEGYMKWMLVFVFAVLAAAHTFLFNGFLQYISWKETFEGLLMFNIPYRYFLIADIIYSKGMSVLKYGFAGFITVWGCLKYNKV